MTLEERLTMIDNKVKNDKQKAKKRRVAIIANGTTANNVNLQLVQ